MRILSVQAGRPALLPVPAGEGEEPEFFRSAIAKRAVAGPVALGARGLVRRAAQAMMNRSVDRAEAMVLVRCEALAEDWRLRLARESLRVRTPWRPQ